MIPRFDRRFFAPDHPMSALGEGALGGKAQGLADIQEVLAARFPPGGSDLSVAIPNLVVLTTSVFDAFLAQNDLEEIITSDLPDERIAHAFLRAELPPSLVGDLRLVAEQVKVPLAVRSSSLLEDTLKTPFAGVYATKMLPCQALDADTRFRRLAEAVKFVFASTYFQEARDYRAAAGVPEGAERMAVILQEVVGRRFGERFYPHVSGVGHSYNHYPFGHASPEDGYAQLALGLGKTIVDGEPAWAYSPAFPKATPPVNSLEELLDSTQRGFWAISLGPRPYDPASEAEFLVRAELADAEADGTLRSVAATFDPGANRIVPGLHVQGPRLVNFAPLLQYQQLPLNPLVRALLETCAEAVGTAVEIEFAVDLEARRCGFLQVRPMALGIDEVHLEAEDLDPSRQLAFSSRTLGNGVLEGLVDVVMVRPGAMDGAAARCAAREVETLNRALVREGRPYLLVGYGRWGTTDPSGGVPVTFPQISGARAIVEAQLPGLRQDPSLGAHFFHNLAAFGVLFLSVPDQGGLDVDWLMAQPALEEGPTVRHLRLSRPLTVKVDGRSRRGVVRHA